MSVSMYADIIAFLTLLWTRFLDMTKYSCYISFASRACGLYRFIVVLACFCLGLELFIPFLKLVCVTNVLVLLAIQKFLFHYLKIIYIIYSVSYCMYEVNMSVLFVCLCLRIPEPEFCDYAFFKLIDHQLQDDMGTWMVTMLDRSPIEWGLPSLSLSGSTSCSGGFLVYAAWVRVTVLLPVHHGHLLDQGARRHRHPKVPPFPMT
jgi:hypothetical protein